MMVRKFRILRLRHQISMAELAKVCGVSAQRISELELSESTPEAETVQNIQNGFEALLTLRGEQLASLRREYADCKDTLMERVGEYEYAL